MRKVRFFVDIEMDEDYHILGVDIESEKLIEDPSTAEDIKVAWSENANKETYCMALKGADETTTLNKLAEVLKIVESKK